MEGVRLRGGRSRSSFGGMNAITRLDADGKVQLPQDVIDAAGLKGELELELRPEGVLVRPRESAATSAIDKAKYFPETSLADLAALRLYKGPPIPIEDISSVSEELLRAHYGRDETGR